MTISRRWIAAAVAAVPVVAAGARAARAHPPAVLSPAAEAAAAEEIIAFRKALAAAIAAKDAAKLKAMYTEGFVHTHTTGRRDGRDNRIVSAITGEPVIETAPADDLVVRVPGGWTAIATGRSPITSMTDGKVNQVRWTAVYVRGPNGDWQLAASHASRIAEGT